MLDAYTHVLPRRYLDQLIDVAPDRAALKRWLELDMLHDVEARLRAIDEFEGYRQILTLSSPPIEAIDGGAIGARLARLANDAMAELCAAHPDQFPGFVAALPMGHVEHAVAELDRALNELGGLGAQLYTNIGGRALDDARFAPVLERLAQSGRPLWLHPARGPQFADYAAEQRSAYEVWWALGWPYETTAAMLRLALSGTLDRLPGLRVITHHMGGLAPMLEGRLALGMDQLGSRTADEDLVALARGLERRPIDYMRSFYADTALFGSASATRCGLDFFGVERCLFASDFPFDPTGGLLLVRETIAAVGALGLGADDHAAIMHRNAETLLGLEVTG